MHIRARVSNTESDHVVEVETEGRRQSLSIAPKAIGRGSSINGGELLFAALATCFYNDLYREAAKRTITVHDVTVDVSGTFGGPGEPGRHAQLHLSPPNRRSRSTNGEQWHAAVRSGARVPLTDI